MLIFFLAIDVHKFNCTFLLMNDMSSVGCDDSLTSDIKEKFLCGRIYMSLTKTDMTFYNNQHQKIANVTFLSCQ